MKKTRTAPFHRGRRQRKYLMANKIMARLRSRFGAVSLLSLFAVEGALLQYVSSINNFGNNLFATNLGASDAQIGLVQTIPNAVAMLLMLPLGVAADKAKSSRTVPLMALLCMAAGYVMMGLAPWAGVLRFPVFFLALAFTVGGLVIYNAQWQNFLGDVIVVEARNNVLTVRNRFMFIVGIVAPLLCGVMMSSCSQADEKLLVLQVFYFGYALVMLLQAAVILRIPTPIRAAGERRAAFSMRDVGETVRTLAHHRPFVMFFIPMLLFYMSWQIDWSMWYIGQVQYLLLTESQMSVFNCVFNIGQLVAVGILSGTVQRKGEDHAMLFAALGLITCPITMIVCSLLPLPFRFVSFMTMVTVFNAPQCAINLCVVQILLKAAPQSCRSMAVSLFTLCTTLTNCFMPLVGVQLYTVLGADLTGLILSCVVTLVLRLGTFGLLWGRYRRARLQA